MITEIILFAVCFGLGVVSRFWYKGLLGLEHKMKNRPAAIVLEFLSVGILACALMLALFFINDGSFMLYTVIAVAIGFTLTSLLL